MKIFTNSESIQLHIPYRPCTWVDKDTNICTYKEMNEILRDSRDLIPMQVKINHQILGTLKEFTKDEEAIIEIKSYEYMYDMIKSMSLTYLESLTLLLSYIEVDGEFELTHIEVYSMLPVPMKLKDDFQFDKLQMCDSRKRYNFSERKVILQEGECENHDKNH